MKITVIHGENTLTSRNKFHDLKKKALLKGFSVQKMTFPPTGDLFNRKVLYVIDGFLRLEAANTKWLMKKSHDFDGHLLIYEAREIPEKLISSLGANVAVEKCNLPKLIFQFLESFYPGQGVRSLKLLHEVGKHEPLEFIFSLLARHLRDLYWVSVSPETHFYPQWRAAKISLQAKKFDKSELESLIYELSKVDIASKTSASDLATSLDLLIVRHLE